MTDAKAATPALQAVVDANIWYEVYRYEHDDALKGFGAEAADKLEIDPKRIFKTLVIRTSEGQLVNAVLAVADMLNPKRVAKALQVKSVKMAEPTQVQNKTGYVLGGISPLGQKLQLSLVADTAVHNHETVIISGGQPGMSVALRVADFLELTEATVATIRR